MLARAPPMLKTDTLSRSSSTRNFAIAGGASSPAPLLRRRSASLNEMALTGDTRLVGFMGFTRLARLGPRMPRESASARSRMWRRRCRALDGEIFAASSLASSSSESESLDRRAASGFPRTGDPMNPVEPLDALVGLAGDVPGDSMSPTSPVDALRRASARTAAAAEDTPARGTSASPAASISPPEAVAGAEALLPLLAADTPEPALEAASYFLKRLGGSMRGGSATRVGSA
mmetsp:Transcript_49168/g.157492  ORF Transcript_49168/g.157492 Transcript_49168/m.157492 type:complete len:232 (-) Transcript_49168:127-822(-)